MGTRRIGDGRLSLRRLTSARTRRIVLGFAGAGIAFATGCSKPAEPPSAVAPIIASTVAMEQEITPQPVRVGPAWIVLKLTAAGQPMTGAHIALEADMSHPGMSPLFADAKEMEPGRYRAPLNFPMAGDWVILLHVTLSGGAKLERQIDIRGVKPNQDYR